MRPRPGSGRPTPAHQEALDRRLALLETELAGLGPDGGRDGHGGALAVPDQPPEEEQPLEQAPARRPPALPVPGRHAAPRRVRRRPWATEQRLPVLDRVAGDAGRWAFGPSQLLVVALVVVLGLAVTAWWVLRSAPAAVPPAGTVTPAAPLVPVTPGGAEPPTGPGATGAPRADAASVSSAAPAGEVEVVVHVAGKVRRPGLVVLPAGARVADAVEAAGGPRPGADLATLNLARPLVDGEQVLVGVPASASAPPGAAPPGAPPVPPSAGELVDLNTADQTLLETLPGVGPVTAAAIIGWRTEHGGFSAVEELLEVDGIGDATLADLAPLVTV